jgi:translation elongation factor EF-Ts
MVLGQRAWSEQAGTRRGRGKIVDGRVAKIAKERALLEQPFIKDTGKSVAEHIKAAVAAIGENIQARRRLCETLHCCAPC